MTKPFYIDVIETLNEAKVPSGIKPTS